MRLLSISGCPAHPLLPVRNWGLGYPRSPLTDAQVGAEAYTGGSIEYEIYCRERIAT